MSNEPLRDGLGRRHEDLRISVTDRCNIRCSYCMPQEAIRFLPREQLLSYEEIEHFVTCVAPVGIRKLRITGGEPLVRAELPQLIARLVQVPGIQDVALTTNGILLAEQASVLRAAGLHRLNISLDTLDEAKFRTITRRTGVHRVLDGIRAAQAAGFDRIRLNTVAMKGISEDDIIPLTEFARREGLELRFIEFMPLDAEQNWQSQQVLTGSEIRAIIESRWGPLQEKPRPHASQPAKDFVYGDGQGRVGLIHPVSQPFCGDCNRIRLTAEGKLRNCLFSTQEWDVRELLRQNADQDRIIEVVRDCLQHKKPGHGIDDPNFLRPERAMYQIGG